MSTSTLPSTSVYSAYITASEQHVVPGLPSTLCNGTRGCSLLTFSHLALLKTHRGARVAIGKYLKFCRNCDQFCWQGGRKVDSLQTFLVSPMTADAHTCPGQAFPKAP